MRVDKDKGYIDLSKRRVSEEEIAKCENKYRMSKEAHSIMSHVAVTCKIPLLKLYEMFGWDLSKRFGHIYDAFQAASADPDPVLDQYNLQPAIKAALMKTIRRRMAPQPFRVRADIEVTCFDYEGIDAIKAALTAGQEVAEKDSVKIKLVAPPLYVIIHTCIQQDVGLKLLEKSIEAIGAVLKQKGGHLLVKEAPRVINDTDEQKLNEEMKTMDKQNQQVSADDAEDC
jgi:translation initiation factor 2 subunit 1